MTTDTRLVLTNAVYFNAAWASQFEESDTQDESFNLLDASTVTVPMMAQTEQFKYIDGDGYEAVELFYDAWELSMVIMVPDTGNFSTFEGNLTNDMLSTMLAGMNTTNMNLKMPSESGTMTLGTVL